MWLLTKQFKFEASHQLMHHDGQCARLHGHSWVMDVTVQGSKLVDEGPKKNMLFDYADVKALVAPIVDELDHRHLNDVFNTDMPTSEYIAQAVFEMLRNRLQRSNGVTLRSVTIHETCTSKCEYNENL